MIDVNSVIWSNLDSSGWQGDGKTVQLLITSLLNQALAAKKAKNEGVT
jgi:hypothetical protein